MTPHSDLDRILLRKMKMSDQSELSPDEASRMKDVRAAYHRNPNVNGDRLYRILRPIEEEPTIGDGQTDSPNEP